MLKVENLTKKFGDFTAVDRVGFEVQSGQTAALLGTSGSGKTTVLRLINRLLDPNEGTITIEGQNVEDQAHHLLRRSIGYVIQNIGLFPHYTVEQNINVVPKLLEWNKEAMHKRAIELLERLDLDPDTNLNKYPSELSGGQQQRIGIARAIAANPPLLLMDEPFGALDPITRKSIHEDFLHLEDLKDKTTLMVTHDVEEAFKLGDRILLMHEGQLIFNGSPSEMLFGETNDMTKNYVEGQKLIRELDTLRFQDLEQQLPNELYEQLNPSQDLLSWYNQALAEGQHERLETVFNAYLTYRSPHNEH